MIIDEINNSSISTDLISNKLFQNNKTTPEREMIATLIITGIEDLDSKYHRQEAINFFSNSIFDMWLSIMDTDHSPYLIVKALIEQGKLPESVIDIRKEKGLDR